MSLAAPRHGAVAGGTHPLLLHRNSILSLIKLLFLTLLHLPVLHASPLRILGEPEADEPKDAEDPTLWIYLTVAMALVLAGGAFAGLTIALMGQDEIYLQVIATSGEGSERKHAQRVLRLLKRGKHWVLVTLLLSNVITNETLPIVLDRSLGGGWPAVLGSTVLIVIFGEIIPQSICVRYGLPIGAWASAPVLMLMYVMAPVAWPTAKLLDKLLGTDHGTTYKKAGLKTLVTLHKTLGEAGEQLNSDEVTIISAVLDLKDKSVGVIMTPMDDVFTMSADTILDEKTMDIILSAGYSRIPIHAPDNPMNFVGMLLVKMLITYDPEDCMPVRDFALATLPETRPETSCLDIVNYFQEGKSHMVLVTDFPGEDCGALGVVTLEDVIEELIGEEIIDELDVFVDVHKAIRRLTPAPWTRVPKGAVVADAAATGPDDTETLIQLDSQDGSTTGARPVGLNRTATADVPSRSRKTSVGTDQLSRSPATKIRLRRSSSIAGHSDGEYITRRTDSSELRDHLKHLGPSNLASRPKSTRYASVKIKPGGGAAAMVHDAQTAANTAANAAASTPPQGPVPDSAPAGGVGEGLVTDAGHSAKDGVMAVQVGYGTLAPPSQQRTGSRGSGESGGAAAAVNKGVQVDSPQVPSGSRSGEHHGAGRHRHHSRQASTEVRAPYPSGGQPSPSVQSLQQHLRHPSRTQSTSTLDSLQSIENDGGGGGVAGIGRRPARSGSITENYVEHGGFTKVVLEMTSSSEENAAGAAGGEGEASASGAGAGAGGSEGHGRDEQRPQGRHHRPHGPRQRHSQQSQTHSQHGQSQTRQPDEAEDGSQSGSKASGKKKSSAKKRWKKKLKGATGGGGKGGGGSGGPESGAGGVGESAPLLGGR